MSYAIPPAGLPSQYRSFSWVRRRLKQPGAEAVIYSITISRRRIVAGFNYRCCNLGMAKIHDLVATHLVLRQPDQTRLGRQVVGLLQQ